MGEGGAVWVRVKLGLGGLGKGVFPPLLVCVYTKGLNCTLVRLNNVRTHSTFLVANQGPWRCSQGWRHSGNPWVHGESDVSLGGGLSLHLLRWP